MVMLPPTVASSTVGTLPLTVIPRWRRRCGDHGRIATPIALGDGDVPDRHVAHVAVASHRLR